MTQTAQHQIDELREIAAEVLEVEPEEITPEGLFAEEHDADSLRAIELLARIEKRFKIDIPQQELPNMVSLRALHEVVAKYAGWQV